MFEITEFIQAHLCSVTNRSEKHGDEDVPAVSLGLELTTANTILDLIDPGLRHALFKAKPDSEPELPGVEATTPVLRCNSIDHVKLTTSHEGWRLLVDDGIDDTKPMTFASVKVDKLSVDAKQGGSVTIKMRLGTSDVDAERLGKLAFQNGQAIWVQLLKPEKKTEAIDGTVEAFERDHPEAGDLFARSVESDGAEGGNPDSDEEEDSEGGATDLEQRLDNALARANAPSTQRSGDWPFPEGATDGSSDMERSARALAAAEQAELEAGMAQAMAAAGVKPSRRAKPMQSKPVGLE